MEVNRLFDSLDTCICQSISVEITSLVSKIAGRKVVLDVLHHYHKEQ